MSNEIEEASAFDDVDAFLEHFGVKGMHWGVSRAVNSSTGRVSKTKQLAPGEHKVGSLRMKAEQFNKLSTGDKQKHLNKLALKKFGITMGAVTAVGIANDKYAQYYLKQAGKALADPKRWLGTATLAKIAVKNVMANGRGKKVADKGLKAIGNLSVYALHQGTNGNWG